MTNKRIAYGTMLEKGSTSYEFARYVALTFIPEQVLNKFWKEDDGSIAKTEKYFH